MKLYFLTPPALARPLFGSSASAQFSVSGGGASIPATGTGGGGTWTTTLPGSPGVSTVTVPTQVFSIGSVEIFGLSHTYMGDLQLVLIDPSGVGHNLFVRPGKDYNGSNFGNSGDFLIGDYTIVETGGSDFPMDNIWVDLNPGAYNQSFTTGTTVWPSGQLNINNTPMSQIAGPAGTWTLSFYDWAGGDQGSFSSWRLNGNGGTAAGNPYCFGDGTGVMCPCSNWGAAGEGCMTSSGTGARLTGGGLPSVSADTFSLNVTGAPANKPGVFFQGAGQISSPAGDGILCSNLSLMHGVMWTDSQGNVSMTGLGASASVGATLNYQYWFRDPGFSCGGGYNFTNGWQTTWQ